MLTTLSPLVLSNMLQCSSCNSLLLCSLGHSYRDLLPRLKQLQYGVSELASGQAQVLPHTTTIIHQAQVAIGLHVQQLREVVNVQ